MGVAVGDAAGEEHAGVSPAAARRKRKPRLVRLSVVIASEKVLQRGAGVQRFGVDFPALCTLRRIGAGSLR
jgi:hypothetical protein